MSKLRLLHFLILSVLASACSVTPPDVFVFESLEQYLATDPATGHLILKPSPACMAKINEPSCGHGIKIISGVEIYVGEAVAAQFNGKPWSQLKRESVYVPAVESYGPLVTYIINACKKMNCSDQVDRFKVKLDSLAGVRALGSVRQ
jgi:hypothetical protein